MAASHEWGSHNLQAELVNSQANATKLEQQQQQAQQALKGTTIIHRLLVPNPALTLHSAHLAGRTVACDTETTFYAFSTA